MPCTGLTAALLALIEKEACTPEGRARVALALRETLQELEGQGAANDDVGVRVAIAGLGEQLAQAVEHVEFLAAVILPRLPPGC